MGVAWRSLVARVLWELSVLQTRSIAITRLSKNITVYLVTISEDLKNVGNTTINRLSGTKLAFCPKILPKEWQCNSEKYLLKTLIKKSFQV